MKIITFYSYKGGTGRSLSLVNTAYALASSLGQKVGMIDLDVEAAALHELVGVEPGDANLLSLLGPRGRNLPDFEAHILKVPLKDRTNASLFLLPCVTDSRLIDEIRWDTGLEVFLRDEIIPAFARIYELDYILIDARSGLSEFANFSIRVSDLVVLSCRPDRQNRFGIGKMVVVCRAAGKPFVTLINSCPEPERNRERLEGFSREIGTEIDFVLPFVEDLYFNETISVLGRNLGPLGASYTELARFIHREMNP